MEASTSGFDWLKIFSVSTGALVLGVVFGSREGGTYVFEIGNNLLVLGILSISFLLVVSILQAYVKTKH